MMQHPETKAQRKARLEKRRQGQLARVPGFTPVRNERIAKAVQSATLFFQMHGQSAVEAQSAAWNHVAKGLPRPRMVKDHRPKPSKSDSPVYRKAVPALSAA